MYLERIFLNLIKYSFLFINTGRNHWTCIVVYMQEKRIQYLDLLGHGGERYTSTVMKYIVDEWKDKNKTAFPDEDKWSIQDD